ncbi:MAG: HDOD domain-containing protein [Desulfobacterales bacterium]|nr:HDOD domain-containing protein [Desulfobacterales bacterium]
MKNNLLTREQRLIRIRNYIDRMPSLSTTVTKVLAVCNQPDTSPRDLNQVISLDPVLTGQVLKLVNSAFYSLPNKITTLTRAIIMLGLNTVKNLVLSTAILGAVTKQGPAPGLAMDLFWTHSISVGVIARALAAARGVPVTMREESFIGGLLHDLGKVVLTSCFPAEYQQALESTRSRFDILPAAETAILGLDHGLAGKMVAEKWQLSSTMTDTLGYHHDPGKAEEKNRELVAIVALANAYANIFDFGTAGDPYQDYDQLTRLLDLTGFQWADLSFLLETVEDEIEKARVFLNVSSTTETQG